MLPHTTECFEKQTVIFVVWLTFTQMAYSNIIEFTPQSYNLL